MLEYFGISKYYIDIRIYAIWVKVVDLIKNTFYAQLGTAVKID